MTLEHVLTMTTGIKWDESTVTYTDPANSCANMEKSQDWIQFVLDQPMADAPGAKFVYNSGATELLSYLIKKGTGKQAHEYAAEHLFGPLGITDTYWKTTPTGLADTEGGLYLTARDLAKIGYLYLHDGVWDGRRLLPEGWVKASTSPKVDTRPGVERSRRYGYQWWVLPYGTAGRYAYRGARLRRPAADRGPRARSDRGVHGLEHLRVAGVRALRRAGPGACGRKVAFRG